MKLTLIPLAMMTGAAWLVGAEAAQAADPLETILGAPAAEWRIAPYQGASNDYQMVEQNGQPVLIAGPNATILTRLEAIKPDTEVMVRLRLAPATNKSASLYFAPGLKSADDAAYNALFLTLNVPAAEEQETVVCQMTTLPGKSQGLYFPYTVRHLPKDRAAWPSMVRARAEQDFASVAPLKERWLTLRYVARKDYALSFIDGVLLRESKGVGVDPAGHVRISVYEGVQIASVRIRPLPPENPLFETIALDQLLNAPPLPTGRPAPVSGVPFAIPGADARGNDHIDVGRSWMMFGALEGGFDPWSGDIPRWRGPMMTEAGRLFFRVRNAPYSRLHLLASFDGAPDKSPVVTAQFYRQNAGHPVSFSARVPAGPPRLITIPLEPEGLASLADQDMLEFELTKEVRIYRAFPDPCYYSQHGAGLPSGVHVYAVTLERPAVEVDFQPDKFAHIWTAPAKAGYTVRLHNRLAKDSEIRLDLSTLSYDGTEKTAQRWSMGVPAGGASSVSLPLELHRYGQHEVTLRIRDDGGTRTMTRRLAYLHPDTRERGGWEEGKGTLWGMWDWNGGHETPSGVPRLEVANAAGIESAMHPFATNYASADDMAFFEAHGMMTHFLAYQFTPSHPAHLGREWDATKPDEMKAAIVDAIKKSPLSTPTRVNKPELAVFYGEPLLGAVSYMSFPEYYGDPPYQMTADEQKLFKRFEDEFVIAASAIKKEWPNAKCLFPWGIPSFPIAYLRHSKAVTDLMDGPAIDLILFERMPEMQMHQVTYASTLWQLKQEWLKAGKAWPTLTSIEGVCTSPSMPGALTQREEADRFIRGVLMLAAYGTTRQLGMPSLFHCAGAWGEQHYGGGSCERLPILSPKLYYTSFATITRQLNRMNYVKAIETGSASVFCLQFKHCTSGALLHVLWTLCGTRPVTFGNGAGAVAYDFQDNLIPASPLRIDTSPSYVWGLAGDAQITLGAPDHSDSLPAKGAVRLANLGDGGWAISEERDNDYETPHLEFIKRFPTKMSIQSVEAPADQGGKALAVHLEPPATERKTMPFYTTLVPAKPVQIAGKPSHLGLWVRAASDWGRFVYALRDAKGERWISVGKKGEWNVDDVHSWSAFNFDGWRYLRFEMPGNAPWDCFREAGTSFWGYYGEGDGIVDLPLSLEKIIVERRTHLIKVDELIPANPADVQLGDLYAEYERPQDNGEEAVRLSRLRMSDVVAGGSPAPAASGATPQGNTPFK